MEATTARKLRPYIVPDGETVDSFDTRSVEVVARNLREGMVLMDAELGTPAAAIDHRVSATRNSGGIAFLVEDLDGSSRAHWYRAEIHRNATVRVLAR